VLTNALQDATRVKKKEGHVREKAHMRGKRGHVGWKWKKNMWENKNSVCGVPAGGMWHIFQRQSDQDHSKETYKKERYWSCLIDQ